jgi:tRNA1(Val) A37 N6-methylase TrmN6
MEVTEGNLLGGKLRYRQFAAGHRSGFEPVLLAAAVPAKPGERVLEAGAGAGAALLCLGYRVPGIVGVGVEIDLALVELANKNFNINGLEDFYCVIGNAAKPALAQKFDHVMANPPWNDAASTNSPDAGRALAHHAKDSLLEDWVKGLVPCLKPHGSITLILPAAALFGAVLYLRAQNCGAISLFPLWPRAGKAAKLVIISAVRGSKGPDRVLPGLVLHDESGITPEAQAVLREGAALRSPER